MEKYCQSCGMLLRRHQGSEADGSPSLEYCRFCYEDGVFLHPDIKSGKEMRKHVYKQLRKEYKTNILTAVFLTFSIPRLKRWRGGGLA